jgi:hypothetical protein
VPPRPRGAIEVKHVLFRYRPGGPEVLKHMSVPIRASISRKKGRSPPTCPADSVSGSP